MLDPCRAATRCSRRNSTYATTNKCRCRPVCPPVRWFHHGCPAGAREVSRVNGNGYAHPEVLVETGWVAEHVGDPGLRVVEADEDVLLYEQGHIPGAVKLDWHLDLNDPLRRDYLGKAQFEALMS